MEARARDFGVGAFLLAGIAAIAFLSISVGGATYRGPGGLDLAVTFDQIGGLKSRAPVVISGVKVGQVATIALDADLRARVVLDVDRALKLPTDTSATILTAGLLGDQYIELTPGGEDKLLGPGDEIQYKQDAFVLERMIGRLIQNLGGSGEGGSEKEGTE
jgi:phospholipid/cholesterol/gamma-HCH transport system substrate-binding protein